jgi:hypothetical protein
METYRGRCAMARNTRSDIPWKYCLSAAICLALMSSVSLSCTCVKEKNCADCDCVLSDDDTADDDNGLADDSNIDDSGDDTGPVIDNVTADIEYVSGGLFSGAAIVMDAAGLVQIVSAKSRQLRVYYLGENGWTWRVADFGVFANPSAALDANGGLHLAYYDWYEKHLCYANEKDGPWVREIVDQDGDIGHYSALAIDLSGAAHIVYDKEASRSSIAARYATNASGAWVAENIAEGTDVGSFPAISLASDGTPHATYDVPGEIRLARKNGGAWETQPLPDAKPYRRASGLGFDSSGVLHVIYHGNDADDRLRHAWGDYDALTFETIPGTFYAGDTLAMTIDAGDVIHFTFQDHVAAGTVYGNNAGGAWTVASLAGGYPVFIAAEATEQVAISLGALGIYQKVEGTFYQNYFDRGFVVADTGIAYDSSGYLHVAYVESTFQSLRYAENTTGAWREEVPVEVVGDGAQSISITIDTEGFAHIIYFNGLDFNLAHVTNATGSWQRAIIDEGPFVGDQSALAIDAQDRLHVSYFDSSNGDLKYATNASGAWLNYAVDTDGLVGAVSDIALDSSGVVHIAYVDRSDNDIKHAAGHDDEWNIEVVDPDGGDNVSLSFDVNGEIVVCYFGAGLRAARKSGESWIYESVDGMAWPMITDMTGGDRPRHTVVYQSLDWNFSLAQSTASGWDTFVLDEVGNTGAQVSLTEFADEKRAAAYISEGAVWVAKIQ